MHYIFTGFLKVEGKIKKDERLKVKIENEDFSSARKSVCRKGEKNESSDY